MSLYGRDEVMGVTARPLTVEGLVRLPSKYTFEETFHRLESSVTSRGLTTFARISFSEDAARAGLAMRPTRMLIFGNPKSGTPLMVAATSLAIDFPLKILVSEDENGKVWVSYNSPEYLMRRHGFPEVLLSNIAGVAVIAREATG